MEGNDSVGHADSPEHAGLFEARTDYGFRSGFNDTRADKQVPAAKLRVANALGISLKLICFDAKLFDDFWMVRVIGQIPEISSPHGTVKVYSFGGFLVSSLGDSRSHLPSGAAKDLLLPAARLAPVDHDS